MKNKKEDKKISEELDKVLDAALNNEKVNEMKREEIKFSNLCFETKENEINFTNLEKNKDSGDNDNNIEVSDKESYVESIDNYDKSVASGNNEANNEDVPITPNKNKIYLGYNTRIAIYLGLIFILGLISVTVMIKSVKINVKRNLTYKQTSSLDYKVGLKPNNYYKEPYLNKGMQYIASLIDNIDINFNYNFKASENINYKYIYYVRADVKVTDSSDASKIIYSKSDKITEEKIVTEQNSKEFNIKENVKINYEEYNSLVKEFKSSYAIDADSNLDLSLCIEIEDKKGNKIKKIDPSDMMTVKIPLTEQMINIKMDYKEINNSDNAVVYKEFNVSNKVLFVISLIILVGMVIVIVKLLKFLNKTSRKKSIYEIKLNRILKEYDRIIVNSKKGIKEAENVIEVSSFEELLDARDNLEKPIIFSEVHKGQKSIFIVRGEKESYRYTLKLVDLERKQKS